MVTGLCIPAAAIRLQCVSVYTVTLVAARCVHAAVLTGAGLQTTLVQIVVTGLPAVSVVTFASVGSDTLSMFTALLTVRLTPSPVHRLPAPATLHTVTIATEAIFRQRHRRRCPVSPAVLVQPLAPGPQTEPGQENQGPHPAASEPENRTGTGTRAQFGSVSRCRNPV